MEFGKMLLLDILGVLLIIISPFTGLVPGPGGIPIFFAGLGLLAINHRWARDLLNYFKTKGSQLVHKIFSDHPAIKWLYDIATVIILYIASWLIIHYTSRFIEGLAIVLIFASIALFLGNRQRLSKLLGWARHR